LDFPETSKLVFIQGTNGSGKSTLLKLLVKNQLILKHTEATPDIELFCKKTKSAVLDFEVPINWIATKTYLNILTIIYDTDTSNEYLETWKKLGLDEFSKTQYGKLSLGTKKKLLILHALFANSDVILLDEPFENLDEQSILVLASCINNRLKLGKQIIISLHNTNALTHFKDYEMVHV
jgi:ABC-2 type transport system ATP-binding protein